jgi:mRNA interferase MazF
MTPVLFVRGQVCFASLRGVDGEKPYVIVSNNARNAALETTLAACITTSSKAHTRTAVAIPEGECCVGYVLCDDIEPLYPEDVRRLVGGLSLSVMLEVGSALKVALALN